MLQFPGGESEEFDLFLRKLDTLLDTGKGDLRVLHVGGSHVQAGTWTDRLRAHFLALRYGLDGGRGLVFPFSAAGTNTPISYSSSYTGNWEKTNKAFVQNPLNDKYREYVYLTGDICYRNERGEIIYCGRKDSQVKHNGYRIELGEIENAVLALKMVDNCCVVYDHCNRKIILFYEAKEEIKTADFRKTISEHIPKYMVPSDYRWETSMKHNQNGKIDRAYYNNQIKK